jgi:tRNA threonylcarbamoyladenosine biosynthesis protein TsaB
MITLALDASTYTGSVAVWRDDQFVADATSPMRDPTHERLMPAVAATLARARATARDLSRVLCGGGPGSFTSLRIAGAIAKGLAFADGAELWSVPSLALIPAGANPKLSPGNYAAVLDALRGELYVGVFKVASDDRLHEIAQPRILAAAALDDFAADFEARVIGPGRGLGCEPHARGAMALLSSGIARLVDLDEWEPEYGRLAEAQVRWEAAHGRPMPKG